MSEYQVIGFIIGLVLLILLSGFFSSAETGLMAVNRYRLRHKARIKKRYAILILRLLQRPDRLLGMILIGNNFSNILASSLATLLAVHLWGDTGAIFSTIVLTFIILVFAEVAPKTLAALHPETVSKWVAWPVFVLLKLFYPLVWFTNAMSNGVLRLFRVKVTTSITEPLSREELRSIVYETSGRLPHQYQNMLLGILDLNKVTVNDVMVPRHEVVGIDIEQDWEDIQRLISQSPYDWLPVYRENINQTVGVLHLREVMHAALNHQIMDKEMLQQMLHEPYFVPENTPLNIQLLNFQRQHKRTALVVDEYGEIQGLLTLADILEEIIGEFTKDVTGANKIIQQQKDGSYIVEGSVTLRELNRVTQWQLPTRGARTLNGLIVEYLESIPHTGTCIRVKDYPIEIVHVQENRVKLARVFPRLGQDEHENLVR